MKVEAQKRGRPGRPPIYDGEKTVVYAVRLNEALVRKINASGGSDWVRKLIENAKEGIDADLQ